MIGTCLWFSVEKGYGFVRSNEQDYFVHFSKIEAEAGEFRTLSEGDVVSFEPFVADRGDGNSKMQAITVRKIEDDAKILRKTEGDSIGRRSQRAEADQVC